MRTALPAPAFLADARERAKLRSAAPSHQIPYHFAVDRTGALVTLKAQWLARHLAENPGARVNIVAASEAGAAQLVEATTRAWADLPTMDERLADVSRGIARQLDQRIADELGLT